MRQPDKPTQLPLDLGHAPAFLRDDLVLTDANRAAVTLIDRWPDWPSAVVILVGPAGSGKSHLASIWRDRSQAVALRGDALEAGPSQGPFVIDDADEGVLDQVGLFHLINETRSAGSQLLLTARTVPANWLVALPDLASRLRAASIVTLGKPDDDLLTGVVSKLFADRQVEVEPHVVQFLVRRMERSLSAAISVVDRIDRMALQQKSRITRAMAAQAVGTCEDVDRNGPE